MFVRVCVPTAGCPPPPSCPPKAHPAVAVDVRQRGRREHVRPERGVVRGQVQVLGPLERARLQVVDNNATWQGGGARGREARDRLCVDVWAHGRISRSTASAPFKPLEAFEQWKHTHTHTHTHDGRTAAGHGLPPRLGFSLGYFPHVGAPHAHLGRARVGTVAHVVSSSPGMFAQHSHTR